MYTLAPCVTHLFHMQCSGQLTAVTELPVQLTTITATMTFSRKNRAVYPALLQLGETCILDN